MERSDLRERGDVKRKRVEKLTMWSTSRGNTVAVLRADPGLVERLPEPRRSHAERVCAAAIMRRDVGVWDAKRDADQGRHGFGLLVLEGMLVRRVGVDDHYGAELLGPGELLQLWQHDGEEATLPFEATWRVLAPLRLAVLDLNWAARMGPFPEVAAELMRRVMVRARALANMMAISHHRRLDDRLRLFFWELADRYGHVHPDGVHLEVPLTHEMISHLVGARRPSVSAALARLEREERLRTLRRGCWVLVGTPPTDEELRDTGVVSADA